MRNGLLGLPLSRALRQLGTERVRITRSCPPRRPEKQGALRVTRAQIQDGVLTLTVSPFEDRLSAPGSEEA